MEFVDLPTSPFFCHNFAINSNCLINMKTTFWGLHWHPLFAQLKEAGLSILSNRSTFENVKILEDHFLIIVTFLMRMSHVLKPDLEKFNLLSSHLPYHPLHLRHASHGPASGSEALADHSPNLGFDRPECSGQFRHLWGLRAVLGGFMRHFSDMDSRQRIQSSSCFSRIS